MNLNLNDAEKAAIKHVLHTLMPAVNHGCDAWLGCPDDDNCLLSYDDPYVAVLNGLLAKLKQ